MRSNWSKSCFCEKLLEETFSNTILKYWSEIMFAKTNGEMWETVKIWKRYTKSQRVLWHKSPLSAACKTVHYQLWLFASYVQLSWLYTCVHRLYNIPLICSLQFKKWISWLLAHYSNFYSISSIFGFITGKVANKKSWKNHRILLHTPTISYPNFSSICSLQLKKWISWLLAHCSHFYIFPVILLEK